MRVVTMPLNVSGTCTCFVMPRSVRSPVMTKAFTPFCRIALALEGALRVLGRVEHVFAVDQVFTSLDGLRLDRGGVDEELDGGLEQVLSSTLMVPENLRKRPLTYAMVLWQRRELDEAVVGVDGPGAASDLGGLFGSCHVNEASP